MHCPVLNVAQIRRPVQRRGLNPRPRPKMRLKYDTQSQDAAQTRRPVLMRYRKTKTEKLKALPKSDLRRGSSPKTRLTSATQS